MVSCFAAFKPSRATHTLMFVAVLLTAPAAFVTSAQQDVPRSTLFDAKTLLRDLQVLSADDMQGRLIGTPGGEKARAFGVQRFKESGITPIGTSLIAPFAFTARGSTAERQAANVIGRVEGTGKTGRYIVITAHYDHIGVRNGEVFNGANDNASGTAALFALGQYFSANRPNNSLIFAALDGEEGGLRGASAFVKQPPVDASAIVLNLNMDMIGRDPKNLLFVSGTRQQPFLKPFIERVAAKAPVTLMMGHDNPAEKEDWTRDSDHFVFCQAKIPCLYFGVEDFDQHHRSTDDYETMTHAFFVRAVETMIHAVKEFDAGLEAVAKAAGRRP